MCLTQKQYLLNIVIFQKKPIKKLLTSEGQPILPQPGTTKSTNPVTRSITKNIGT